MIYRRLTLKGITLEDFEYLFKVKRKLRESRQDAVFAAARKNIGKRVLDKAEKERVKLRFNSPR